MVNFYAFWTMEQGDSTATVNMLLHHSLYFQRFNNYGPGGWAPRMPEGGALDLCTAQPA